MNETTHRQIVFMVSLILIGVLLYAVSLTYPFFLFDDALHITENNNVIYPTIGNMVGYWFDAKSKIPVVFNSWQLISFFFGTVNAGVFRLFNLLIHCMNGALVFAILVKISDIIFNIKKENEQEEKLRDQLSFISALFFMIHPVQVESVVWISSMKGVLATFWSLISILFYLKSDGENEKKQLFFVTIFLILGILSKPSVVVIPFVYVLFDIFLFKLSMKKTLYRNLHYIFLGTIIVALQLVEYRPEVAEAEGATFVMKSLLVVTSLAKYFKLIIFPNELVFDYQMNYAIIKYILKSEHGTLRLNLLITILFLWGLIFSLVKEKFRYFGMALMVFVITLSVNIGVVENDFSRISTVADRYLYTPLFGMSLLLMISLYSAAKKTNKKFVITIMLFVYSGFMLKAIHQISMWENDLKYFTFSEQVNKWSPAVTEALVYAYLNDKNTGMALNKFFEKGALLGKGQSILAEKILKELARNKMVEEGQFLIEYVKQRRIELPNRAFFDFYLESNSFPLISEKILGDAPVVSQEVIQDYMKMANQMQKETYFPVYLGLSRFFYEIANKKMALDFAQRAIENALTENQKTYAKLLKDIISKAEFKEEAAQ